MRFTAVPIWRHSLVVFPADTGGEDYGHLVNVLVWDTSLLMSEVKLVSIYTHIFIVRQVAGTKGAL